MRAVTVLIIAQVTLAWVLAVPAASAQDATDVPWADGRSRAEDIRVIFVTGGPGTETQFARFGHSALIVADEAWDTSRLYNYGTYTFNESFAYVKAGTGHAQYWLSVSDPQKFLRTYKEADRDVRFMQLDLPPEKALALAQALADAARPENRYYPYHILGDNCATRVRDILNATLDGAVWDAAQGPANGSLREVIAPYFGNDPAVGFTLSLLANANADAPLSRWDTLFLPLELESVVRNVTIVHPDGEERPLVGTEWTWHASSQGSLLAPFPDLPPRLLVAGALVGAGVVASGAWARRSTHGLRALGVVTTLAGLALGLPGLFLTLAWTFDRTQLHFPNQNLLLVNALTLVAVPYGVLLVRGYTRALDRLNRLWTGLVALGVLALVLKLTPFASQDNAMHLALVVPILVGFGVAFRVAASARIRRAGTRVVTLVTP